MEEQLTLLVVDDDVVDRTVVRRALRAAGMSVRVDEATDRDSALERLASGGYDCVLMDYRLPGADGLAVIQEMRRRGITTPVVALTGHGDEELVVSLMKAGATDYLTKGAVSPERLAQSIRTAVRVHRAEEQARQAELALRASVERLRFLAEASRLLASALDATSVLGDLARLIVDAGVDWCAIDLAQGEDSLRRAASAARADLPEGKADELGALFPVDAPHSFGPQAALQSGRAQAFPPLPGAESELTAELQEAWDAAGVSAALCIPLIARDRRLGAITAVLARPGCRYSEDDLVLALDVGQRAASALDTAYLYRAAQEAIQLRDNFLSIASHELKTPLTSLYGNAQLLRRRMQRAGELSERDDRALAVIVEQSARLDRMISMLLDISRLQTGRLTIQRETVDVAALIRALVDEVRPTLDEHTIELVGADERIEITGDELRLHQVMMNLLQNAVKYSPPGTMVTVRVEQRRDSVCISVIDRGIGVPEQDLPHLFSQFFRATNAQERNIGGIGLGLYVVHQIVTLHGGTVEVQSVEGQGSTFTVVLPLAEAHAAYQVAEAVGPP
ncbi:MAG: ATP-binding protein [Chloroflexota bacterium]